MPITTMNIEEIKKYVPHRYPFLMLDKITNIDYEKHTLVAIKNVTINEPIFTGHFPEEAIFPGVMIIEALAQASGMLVYMSALHAGKSTSNLYYLAGIDLVKFKKPVRPGDQLHLHVELMQEKKDFSIFKTKCVAKVDDVIVCSAELLCVKKEDAVNIKIHPTAKVDPSAIIGKDVEIGPYSVIGSDVEIGEGSWIGPHVVISKLTKMGKNNKVYQFASLGEDPQDLHFAGEASRLEIGDNNIFRESVTISRGTAKQDMLTKIGSHNLFMAYSHVAHDCVIGNHCVFANGATLAGHIVVDDYVTISAFCAVHQFCNIGAHSFLAYAAMVNKDVLPYLMIAGNDPTTYGLNKVGLERRGFSKETIASLQTAYKIIFKKGLTLENAKLELQAMSKESPEIKLLLDGIERSKRGIVR